jgi:hypothetical protein
VRVAVKLKGLPSEWGSACRHATTVLNGVFKTKRINVVLEADGNTGPTISVQADSSIVGLHGHTTAQTNNGVLTAADVHLPGNALVSTPARVRKPGPGVLQVIAAHEFVHALGQTDHDSHLMTWKMDVAAGDTPSEDKLRAGAILLPPIALSDESIALLRSIWP